MDLLTLLLATALCTAVQVSSQLSIIRTTSTSLEWNLGTSLSSGKKFSVEVLHDTGTSKVQVIDEPISAKTKTYKATGLRPNNIYSLRLYIPGVPSSDIVSAPTYTNLRCYKCNKAFTIGQCTRVVECSANERQCETHVRYLADSRRRFEITKGCKKISDMCERNPERVAILREMTAPTGELSKEQILETMPGLAYFRDLDALLDSSPAILKKVKSLFEKKKKSKLSDALKSRCSNYNPSNDKFCSCCCSSDRCNHALLDCGLTPPPSIADPEPLPPDIATAAPTTTHPPIRRYVSKRTACTGTNGGCDQICKPINKNAVKCSCNKGFELQENKKSCKALEESAIANAGPDITVILPASKIVITGKETKGSVKTYSWWEPIALGTGAGLTISNPYERDITVTNLRPGNYKFVLTVTGMDGRRSTDIMELTVKKQNEPDFPKPAGLRRIASAFTQSRFSSAQQRFDWLKYRKEKGITTPAPTEYTRVKTLPTKKPDFKIIKQTFAPGRRPIRTTKATPTKATTPKTPTKPARGGKKWGKRTTTEQTPPAVVKTPRKPKGGKKGPKGKQLPKKGKGKVGRVKSFKPEPSPTMIKKPTTTTPKRKFTPKKPLTSKKPGTTPKRPLPPKKKTTTKKPAPKVPTKPLTRKQKLLRAKNKLKNGKKKWKANAKLKMLKLRPKPTKKLAVRPTKLITTKAVTTSMSTEETTTSESCVDTDLKCGFADVIIAVDAMTTVPPMQYAKMLRFISDMVSKQQLGKTKVQIGLIHLSGKTLVKIPLGGELSIFNVNKAIMALKIGRKPGVSLGRLFNYLRLKGFSVPANRPDASDHVIVFLDSKSNDEFTQQAKALQDTGVKIHVVGIRDIKVPISRMLTKQYLNIFNDTTFLKSGIRSLTSSLESEFDADFCTTKCKSSVSTSDTSPALIVCPRGFENIAGKCQEINKCLVNNGECEHLCLNDVASYHCECYEGFLLREDNKTCEDIDECLFDNGGCQHICMNKNGTHICQCKDDFIFDDNSSTCVATCSALSQPLGSQLTCSSDVMSSGVTCSMTCGAESDVTGGPSSVTCRNGNWTSKLGCCETECPPYGNADVIIAVDAMVTATPFQYKKLLNFISELVTEYKIGQTKVQLGLIHLSGQTLVKIPLGGELSIVNVNKAIMALKIGRKPGVSLGRLFNYIRLKGFSVPANRPDASDHVIVFLGSKSKDKFAGEAKALENAGVKLHVVGIRNFKSPISQRLTNSYLEDLSHVTFLNRGVADLTELLKREFKNDFCTSQCKEMKITSELARLHEEGIIKLKSYSPVKPLKNKFTSFNPEDNRENATQVTTRDSCPSLVALQKRKVQSTCNDGYFVGSKCTFSCLGKKQLLRGGSKSTTCQSDEGKSFWISGEMPLALPCCERPIVCPRDAYADIIFLIHSTDDILKIGWVFVLAFAQSLMRKYTIGHENVCIGLVRYNSEPDVDSELELSCTRTMDEIERLLQDMPLHGNGTYTGLALQHLLEKSFNTSANRPSATDVAVVITDSESVDDVTGPIKQLKLAGVKIQAIGLKTPAGSANVEELKLMATDPEKNVVSLDRVKSIAPPEIQMRLRPLVCPTICQRYNHVTLPEIYTKVAKLKTNLE